VNETTFPWEKTNSTKFFAGVWGRLSFKKEPPVFRPQLAPAPEQKTQSVCRKVFPGKTLPKQIAQFGLKKKPSACVAGAEGEEGMDPCAVQWKDEGGLKTSCRTFGTEPCVDEVLGKSVGLAVP